MNNAKKNTANKSDLQKEHEELMKSASQHPVVITTEWRQPGDFFTQLTTYDFSLRPVKTFGGTTMIALSKP
ncbi:MAG: hypothetical protein LBB79_04375 [Prevotellaceae bacterium]|jgi:hypothetical protein|nr:hypothetical protein [Prevotellaceae bacterium]